jgi:hypothetical protein
MNHHRAAGSSINACLLLWLNAEALMTTVNLAYCQELGDLCVKEQSVKRAALIVLVLAAATMAGVPRSPVDAATCRPTLTKIAVSPRSVPGGARATVTVALSCVTSTALTVHLTGFKGATTPSAIRVARHKSSGRAMIRTEIRKATKHGDVVATLGRTRRSAALTVTKTPRTCKSPRLTGVKIPSLVYVGNRPAATVRLSCAPTSPIRLSLTSSNPDLIAPADVTVGRYYDTATIGLDPTADQSGQYSATITVRYKAQTLARSMTVEPGLENFLIPAASEPNFVQPEVLFTGIAPTGGLTVRLASDNPAITVPATFTAPAGSVGGGFNVTVQPVTKDTTVTLTATFGGRTLRATTTLLPPFGPGDTVTLAAEAGAGPIYGQEHDLEYIVLLSNPAPASGENVTFAATDPSIELQSTTDFITGGFDDGFVDIDTTNITSPVHAKLTATVEGITATLPITIEPGLASISNVPATITGGESFTGTVNLAGPVDTATTIELQSTWGILTVPTLVTVRAGQSSVNFTATTVAVTSDSDVNINASLGSTEITSSTVTLTP